MIDVARSDLIERLQGGARPRNAYRRTDDYAILAIIRTVTDVRPAYGCRRVTAISNWTWCATGEPLLNHKDGFRLMR
ncbi:hypothetical protein FOHLNKBM_4994 [Methylobacterium longum]|nr:hypothetical protein FOHLNKBM_4994 [Methylobacterium longum]